MSFRVGSMIDAGTWPPSAFPRAGEDADEIVNLANRRGR
jgi:hypothetical protein